MGVDGGGQERRSSKRGLARAVRSFTPRTLSLSLCGMEAVVDPASDTTSLFYVFIYVLCIRVRLTVLCFLVKISGFLRRFESQLLNRR